MYLSACIPYQSDQSPITNSEWKESMPKKMLLCNKVTEPILTEFGIWLVPLFMAQSSAHVLCSQQQWFCFTENNALGHSSAFRLSVFALMKTAMNAAVHTTFDTCLQFYTLYVYGKMRGTRSEYVINEWDCTNRNFDFQHWYTHTNTHRDIPFIISSIVSNSDRCLSKHWLFAH